MLSRLFGSWKERNPAYTTATEGLIPSWHKIIIPASGAPFSLRSVQNAARFAAKCPGCEVRLLYVIEVPRAFALQAPMPGEDSQAQTVLADGLEEARRCNLDATTEVLRVREVVDGLLKYIDQQEGDLVILGVRPDEVRGLPSDIATQIFRRSPCEVIVDYIADEQ